VRARTQAPMSKNQVMNGANEPPAAPKRGPGRPRNRPVDLEYEALVAAAVTVFGRRGRQAATIEEIAQVAGIKKASVYAHFAGREDLLTAADSAALERLAAVMTKAYEDSRLLPTDERVRMQIAGFFSYAESDPDGCELIMSAERVAEHRAEQEALAGADRMRDSIVTGSTAIIAEEMIAAGLPRRAVDDRAALVATMLLGMVEFTARRLLVHQLWDRESVITILTQATISGISGVDPDLSPTAAVAVPPA